MFAEQRNLQQVELAKVSAFFLLYRSIPRDIPDLALRPSDFCSSSRMINQKKRLEHQGFWDFFWKSPTSKEDWKKKQQHIYLYIEQ